MENLKRSIRIFFATYGSLLFKSIGIIVVILLILRGVNYVYKIENDINNKNDKQIIENENQKQQVTKLEKENKQFISLFLDCCNEGNIEEAYNMLSEQCKQEKFQTIEKFKTEYINKIFEYKKEYKINKEENKYAINIYEGILQSGSKENRKFISTNYEVKEEILGKKIYIER